MSRIGPTLLLLLFACTPWLSACTDNEPAREKQEASSQTASEPVLALVDGTPITQFDVEQAMERFFSEQAQVVNREQVERQILKSLVSSRAISRLAAKELTPTDRQILDARVAAFREELLIKNYLQVHANPQPVTTEMVERYYREHGEEFGGGLSNSFEMIQTNRELKEAERRKLIKLLGALAAEPDWKTWAERHAGLPIGWRRLSAKTALLEQPLQGLVETTEAGGTSSLHVGDRLTIVRVNAKRELPPKPLMQVSADIRRRLAPIRMKEAIKEISEHAEKQIKIEIVNPGDQGSIND